MIATLENDSSRATIFSYEAGDSRPGGGVFAGRRLAWPHGWAETFTTEGATLFEQSIGWLLEGSTPSVPVITTPPQSQGVPVGETASFSVVASGSGLSYQWQLDSAEISGANAATFETTASETTAGAYTVRVSNGAGVVVSEPATLTLLPALSAPTFIDQPADLSVTTGAEVTFSASVVGNPTPTLQWQRDGVDIPGATSSQLSFFADLNDAGTYQLIATNSEDTVSSAQAVLEVSEQPAAPVITSQPVDVTVNEGEVAEFAVVADGNPSPTYQWQRDSLDIPGETGANLSIAAAEFSDAGSYAVVVSNSEGDVTSDAAVLVVEPGLFAPSIVTQPADVTVIEGEVADFTVVANGNPSPTYQWQRDGADIAGETSASFSIASTETVDAGSYTVVVSNSEGDVTSEEAVLVVEPGLFAPSIVTQPADLSVAAGEAAAFVVCLLYTSPSPRDLSTSRMPSSA